MRRLLATVLCLALPAAAPAAVGVGDRPPAVTLPSRAGPPVTLADLRGKVVVVDFWATWCAPCAAALPALDAMARRHASEGLAVVAIGIDKDPETAERFLAQRLPEPSLTLLRDPGGTTMARFGAAGMPALYLLDRDGTVRRIEAGYEADKLADVEAEVTKLLASPRP